MATTIVLVRHGQTDWNVERRFQGHADTPLNEAGRRQARELAETLAGERFVATYSSPLRRALETATIVSECHCLAVEPSAALMEVDVGSWSGLTTAEVEMRFPDGFARWRREAVGWHDGETYEALGRRVVAGLLDIAGRHADGSVLAVTHGGPIRSVLAAAQGLSFESARSRIGIVENCAIVRIAVREGEIEAVD